GHFTSFLTLQRTPRASLFPYTTLFRSRRSTFKRIRNYVKSLPHEEAMAWVDEFCAAQGVSPIPNPVLSWDELRQLAAEGDTLGRSEEHTSELQSRENLVCRLLLEKKNQ